MPAIFRDQAQQYSLGTGTSFILTWELAGSGTWLNSILYTLEILAVIRFRSASKRNRESRWLQGVVYFTLFVDTISTLANYACVYFYTITHWGELGNIDSRLWASVVSLATICASETIVQLFLIYRFYRMSKNKYITPVLVLFVFAEFGGSVEAIHLFKTTTFQEGNKLVTSAIIWFSMSAVTDTAIALALIWQLRRIKSPFKGTQSLVYKLIGATISTGTVTSAVVLVSLILFVLDTQSNASMTPGFCLGRIYALTMLYNLNSRGSYKAGSANADDYSGETSNGMNIMKTIHVHTTGLSELSTKQDPDPPAPPEAYLATLVEKTSAYP